MNSVRATLPALFALTALVSPAEGQTTTPEALQTHTFRVVTVAEATPFQKGERP